MFYDKCNAVNEQEIFGTLTFPVLESGEQVVKNKRKYYNK
ncbi:hypothetical protein ANACOL_04273 [Anaerotruncus colihominis DSM 17241]|uniref:Uncharacterized protein n=1 Tax=Anaerotruncus colihominis DSM 17241 TaxID=445972 RepID=B0PHH9_9FIRM|nr:hypothetical protein ANACOL_04273 [Anaerotruncus colihominis DSM 17241]